MLVHRIITVAVIALTGCSDGPPSSALDTTVQGIGVIDHISQHTIDGLPNINVRSVKGTPLGAIAHLALFEDFAPGLTFDEARKRFGEPTTTRTLVNGTELRCYRRDITTLAVAREPLRSSSPAAERRTVWAFPNEGGLRLDSLVASNVVEQVHSPSLPFYLVLRDSTPMEQSLWLRVDSPGVTEVRWLNSESYRKRRD